MKIFVGSPVHGRLNILPYYLEALDRVESITEKIFLANNCSEEEIKLLKRHGLVYQMNDVKSHSERRSDRHASLAILRNKLLDIVFNEYKSDYFLSVDSDIIVYPEIVKSLLSFNKDIISNLVYNDLHFSIADKPHESHIGNIMKKENGSLRHIKPIPMNKLIEVDLTGAVYLINRRVYDAGVRYANRPKGEDAGFCEDAQRKGFKLYCYTRLCEHLMTDKIVKEWEANCLT